MGSQIANLTSGITAEDMANVVGAFTNGQIDEDKLVKAYMANKE